MNFLHSTRLSVRPGGYERDTWDDLGALSNTSVVLNGVVYTYYRGYDTPETSGGQFRIGVMTCPANDFRPENFVWPAAATTLRASDHFSVLGGETPQWGDMHAIVVGGTIHLYVTVQGGGIRLARYTSTNGTTLTYQGEITFSGGNWGSNIRALYYTGGRLYFLGGIASLVTSGSGARMRSAADFVTFTDHGRVMEPTGVTGDYNSYTLITGRGWQDTTYAYALIPGGGHVEHNDWPEGMGLYRCPLAELGVTNRVWDVYHRNPVMHRAPNEGGCWQLGAVEDGFQIGQQRMYQMWGINGYDAVGTATMNSIRDTPYSGANTTSFKHIQTVAASSLLALEDWEFDPLPNGQYLVQNANTGHYLSFDGNTVIQSSTKTDAAVLTLTRQHTYYTLRRGSVYLRMSANSRIIGAVAEGGAFTGAVDYSAHWFLPLVDNRGPGRKTYAAQIVNRYSSLGLVPDGANVVQRAALNGARSQWNFIRL